MTMLLPPSPVDHLVTHRRLVIEGSLLAGVVGVIPIPVVDDVLTGIARGRLFRRLADRRQVDLDRSAILVLCEDRQTTMLRNATLAALTLVLARYWRRVFPVLAVGRRVDEMVHTFQMGTLFDHYCARHHVGAAVKGADAARLRFAMDRVQESLHRELVGRVFERAAGRAALGLKGAPRALGRLFRRGPAAATEDEVLDEVAANLSDEGFLRKTARVVDEELGAAGATYLRELVDRFDAVWAEVKAQAEAAAAGPPPAGPLPGDPPPAGGSAS
ncbi:MAG TPA: hypothetical protein VGQ83_41835 [Polyangia bacterium]|jgi:hypothetical protein